MSPEERRARIAKLPRWAQDEIRDLRNDLDAARSVAETISAERAIAYTDPYGRYPRPVVRAGDHLRFPFDGLDGHDWIDVGYLGDGRIELRGSSGLAIMPSASNVAQVEVRAWGS